MYRKQFMCSFIMLMMCMLNVYSQSVVDFGTDLYSTKYYESMNAANPPAGEWYAVDYDDSSWKSYTNPLTFPANDAFWVRRTFTITDDPANHTFQLKYAHDDGAQIYINGHLIHDHDGCCSRYNSVTVPSEYLVNGINVLAASVIDTGGEQWLECFISVTDESDIILDLPAEPLLSLSQTEISLYYGVNGYSDYTLSALFVTPTGKSDSQVSWTSSDQNVVSVTDGHIVALSAGNSVVTASASYNGATYSKECAVTVRATAHGSKIVIVDEPGTLGTLLTDDEKNNVTSLTVFGKLNAEDVHLLRYMTGRDKDGYVTTGMLTDLDIYNVTFVNEDIGINVQNWGGAPCNLANGLFTYLFCGCGVLKSIVLPKNITSIGSSAFYGCFSLTSLIIPESVTSIGSKAFCGCSSLTSIVIPDGVTSIGSYAFEGCSSLTSIDIPAGVTSIGECAFYGCSSLKSSIVIPDGVTTILRNTFAGCSSLTSIVIPESVTTIRSSAFSGCSSLKSIVIPNSVTIIEGSAFQNCSSLASVQISDAVTSIADYSFENCSSLTSVMIPDKVTSIGYSAFRGCVSLTSITIPAGITAIENNTFYDCSSLSSIVLPDGLLKIGSNSFQNCKSLSSINIPDKVLTIGSAAFTSCESLQSVAIPDGINTIGYFVFYNCKSLTSVTIPESVTVIDENAFQNCSFTSIVIPDGVNTIKKSAFAGCSSLTSIFIPDGVTSIGEDAFSRCSSLTSVDIPNGLTSLGRGIFSDCSTLIWCTIRGGEVADYNIYKAIDPDKRLILVDDGLYDQYEADPLWEDYCKNIISADMLKQKTVELTAHESRSSLFNLLGDSSLYTVNLKIKGSINGYDIMALRNKTIKLLYLDLSEADIVANDGGYEYYTGYSLKEDNVLDEHSFADLILREVVLPKSLKSIGKDAFKNCKYLEKVVLQDGLVSIGNSAFEGCAITDINLPNSLLEIGERSFRNSKLSGTLSIPDQITEIKPQSFANTLIDSLIIGQNVNSISYAVNSWNDGGAFSGCNNLKGIKFNRKLKIIGKNAFSNCENLTAANLPYTVELIQDDAFNKCTSLKSIKIPSMTKKIGNRAFANCNNIRNVYTYTVEPTEINQETFSCYTKAILNVPMTSADLYIYNTQWSQFTKVHEFDEPYDAFYLNGDVELNDETGRMSGEPDAEMNSTSGFIIEGDAKQELSTLELIHDGTNGASIIGASKDVTGSQVNLTAKSMNVNISVEGNRWYFFCFPFNVALDSIECTSEYIIYSYDGQKRAGEGTGWNRLGAQTAALEKGLGYIFQASKTGILTIHVGSDYLTFTANNEKEALHTYESTDAANASWNFVGNPFISYYDVKDLAAEYDAPIVVWNGNGYDAYKPGDDDYQLHPFQAFFVQKASGKQSIEFKPESRKTYNQAVAKTEERAKQRAATGIAINPERLLVNITIKNAEDLTDRTRIVYNDKAKMEYEIGTDISKFHTDGVPQLYTLNGTTRYAINERPMGGDEIKLGYIAPKAGVYTLSVPRQDAEIEIYDNVAGTVVDFTFGDYTFETAAGTFNDRFVVRKTGGVTAIKNGFRLDGLTVTTTNGGLDIEGRMAGKVSVYTESGVLITEPAQTGRVELSDGVYIIKIGEKSVKMNVVM